MTYNNENAIMETKKDFILPAMVEDDCISVDVSEDYEGLRLSFPRVKIPGGGSLQFEIPSDDPENPDYTKYIEGVILYNHDTCAYWPEGSEYDDKPTYLRTLNSQLSAIFNFAVKYYGLSSNPVQKSGTIGKKNSGLEQIWTADEFKFFIDAVSDKLQSKVIFNLLYWTGMRSGEMLALTLNDFDFEERTVSITKNYARIDGEDLFLDPKTPKSNRKITLPQFVCDMVKDYADRLYGYDPSDRLFEVTKHYLKHEMERGCKKTGLREIRVHDLRHSHASLLIELGFAPLLISERLGHESVTTTLEIYSHLYPTKHGEVADRLEAFA